MAYMLKCWLQILIELMNAEHNRNTQNDMNPVERKDDNS